MAAYAALLSLMTTLNNIQIHPRVSTFFYHKQIQSLQQIINFLLDFIESSNSNGGSREEEEVLESINSTTHAAEDVIESHVVDQILAGSTHLIDLETQIEDMNSLKETVMVIEFQRKMKFEDEQSSSPASSKPLTTAKKDFVVGFEDKVNKIMERLTGHQPDLQIVPIVGMGGIGKTTLAQSVYHNLLTVERFDIRAWVTISQEYSVKYVLSELLSCIKDPKINVSIGAVEFETGLETEDYKLGLKLYQTLWGRRYLIVLDDIWSLEAWDKIKCFFPNKCDRSRVVITTRMSSVATHLSSSSFEMNFLGEDHSWELFCMNVFLEKSCPHELEEIGKKIVRECKGLPLSIVVIGGLLRNFRSTRECWEDFARDLNSILMSGNDSHCLNILSLSYNHLPAHLKPYFLYMGVFEEDEKIRVSKLIELLVAEGFLKSKEGLTLEEVAEDYLNELVDRNLILVSSRRWDGRIEYCKMHDLVREVCLKIGVREKMFLGMRNIYIPSGFNKKRRIVFDGPNQKNFFLRVLKVSANVERVSLEDIFQRVNLRYLVLELKCANLSSKLRSLVSLLWNVQTLIFVENYDRLNAPSEIWYMRQLRHLYSYKVGLPDPPVEQQDDALLPNLHTLSNVVDFSFTEEACKNIPKMKELSIEYTECKKKCYYDLGHLHKLQSLDCSFEVPKRGEFLQSLVFPCSLRELSLTDCGLHWEDLNTFGLSLPHLEFLELYRTAVVGPEWDCVEEAFPRLKVLQIHFIDLIKWTAESSEFFPVLEKLYLQDLSKLEKIPSGMGEIHTLGSLRLTGCSLSATISAAEILEEQLNVGNDDLQLEVNFYLNDHEAEKSFLEDVEKKGFTSKNFKLNCCYYSFS